MNKDLIKSFIDSRGNLNYNYYKKYFPKITHEQIQELYNIYNDIKEIPSCKICGKRILFVSFKTGYIFDEYCSKRCYNKDHKRNIGKTFKKYSITEKSVEYFLENPKNLDTPKDYRTPTEYIYCYVNKIEPKKCQCGKPVIFYSYEKGYGVACSSKCAALLEDTKRKRVETNLRKYDIEHVSQDVKIREKQIKTKEYRYGDPTYNNSEKRKQTCLEKYGYDNVLKIPEKIEAYNKNRVRSIRESSKLPNKWVKRPENIDFNIEKRKKTCLERYGVEHYTQSNEAKQRLPDTVKKIWNTKKKNGTTNTSKAEDTIYNILSKNFKEVYREYTSAQYPFHCDFYIKDLNMYIEYQGFFTHGGDIFLNDKDDKKILKKWLEKSENSKFYKNAINIWTKKDVSKRIIAKNKKLLFLEIFDSYISEEFLLEQIDRLVDLRIKFNEKDLVHEYQKIKNSKGSLTARPAHNKIIKNFQPHFFEVERSLYRDPVLKGKLIKNRKKYLHKEEHEMSTREILSGFKISGLYKGYSYFSPLWFKYFIERFKLKRVYDPTGGWGHRLLGSSDLDSYIYNDFSTDTCEGVKKIVSFLDIKNTKIYNENAIYFTPPEKFDAVFTCPPYINTEKYQKNMNTSDFKDFLSKIFSFEVLVGLIVKEDLEYLLPPYDEKFLVNQSKSHFGKSKQEYLYVFNIHDKK